MERQERPLIDRPRYVSTSPVNTKKDKKTTSKKTTNKKTTKKRKPKVTDKQLQEAKKAMDAMLLASGSMNNIDNNIKVKSKSTKFKKTSPSKKSKKDGSVFKKWLK